MKKIFSLTLAALILVTLLLTVTSCDVSMETMTGYTQLRDYVYNEVGDNTAIPLDAKIAKLKSVTVSTSMSEGEDRDVRVIGYTLLDNSVLQIILVLDGSSEKAYALYEVLNASDGKVLSRAQITVLLTHYTGDDLVIFDEVENITPITEVVHRENASALLNSVLLALDTYTTSELDMDLHDLGFIVLSEKYMADVEQTEAEEDLGGIFSPERLSMAGIMVIQGMGMVFLVLFVLWLVLIGFKKIFYKDPAKESPKEPKPVSVAPSAESAMAAPAPVATSDDGALVAAITAAVAAYIDSDPALASQFAGGFRVVSFKPTTKSRNR